MCSKNEKERRKTEDRIVFQMASDDNLVLENSMILETAQTELFSSKSHASFLKLCHIYIQICSCMYYSCSMICPSFVFRSKFIFIEYY